MYVSDAMGMFVLNVFLYRIHCLEQVVSFKFKRKVKPFFVNMNIDSLSLSLCVCVCVC